MKATIKNNGKKICIGVLLVGLIATLGIGGTLAFLTDSEQVTNTFSMGDLDITLDESKWDDDGDGDKDEDNVDGDNDPNNGDGRNLVPGDTKEKNPTVHAVKGDSYMRVVMMIKDKSGDIITDGERLGLIWETIRYDSEYKIVKNEHYLLKDLEGIGNINPMFIKDTDRSEPGIYFYNYTEEFKAGDKVEFFTHIVIPGDWDSKELKVLGEYKIVIQAQAIQSQNIAKDKAFDLLDEEIEADRVDKNYGVVGGSPDKEGSSDKEYDIVYKSLTV